MATDMSVFMNGASPLSAARRGEVDELTKSLAGGSQYKRISIRGNMFRMVVNGKEVAVNEDRAMNVIIVAAAPHNSRTFYESSYSEGAKTGPTCQSKNGVTPDTGVSKPQSSRCETCPQNIKGSGQGDSRACRWSRRLAVVLENDLSSGDIYQLVLPAQSLFGTGEANKMPLQQYAQFMAGHGISVTTVVTELRFDINSNTPKLTFRGVRPLTDEELETVLLLGKTKDAQDAINYDPSVLDGTASTNSTTPTPRAEEAPVVFSQPAKKAAPPAEDEPASVEPTKRASKKPVEEVKDISSLLDSWDD